MNKNKMMSIALAVIALGVLNLFAFVLPFSRTNSFWMGYAFAMIAALLLLGVTFYVASRPGLKSKVFGFPLVYIAWTYLIVQLPVSVVQMIIESESVRYQLMVNAFLLAACLIGLIATEVGRDVVEAVGVRVGEKRFFIQSLVADIESLKHDVGDANLEKQLADLEETVRYSDPMSSDQLAALENKIEVKASQLADNINTKDLVKANADIAELQRLFAERNRKCKVLKGV